MKNIHSCEYVTEKRYEFPDITIIDVRLVKKTLKNLSEPETLPYGILKLNEKSVTCVMYDIHLCN